MAAAGGGHAKVVALLLDNGAEADKLSCVGMLPSISEQKNKNLDVRPSVRLDLNESDCIVLGTRVSVR
jgi:hypothetical protein|eukprot:COSAG02_NODE_39_length_48074_cov_106.508890_34_plen_68_part_00